MPRLVAQRLTLSPAMHRNIERTDMEYFYTTARGRAVLNKGDEAPIVKIGTFKTEREALEACRTHYVKACRALQNLNKPIPKAFFI